MKKQMCLLLHHMMGLLKGHLVRSMIRIQLWLFLSVRLMLTMARKHGFIFKKKIYSSTFLFDLLLFIKDDPLSEMKCYFSLVAHWLWQNWHLANATTAKVQSEWDLMIKLPQSLVNLLRIVA